MNVSFMNISNISSMNVSVISAVSAIEQQIVDCHTITDVNILFAYCIIPVLNNIILSLFSDKIKPISNDSIQLVEMSEMCINENYYNIPINIDDNQIIERVLNLKVNMDSDMYNVIYETTKYYDSPAFYNICYFVDMINDLQYLVSNHTEYFNYTIYREETKNIVETIIYTENMLSALEFVAKYDIDNIYYALESINGQIKEVVEKLVKSIKQITHIDIKIDLDREDIRQELEQLKSIF